MAVAVVVRLKQWTMYGLSAARTKKVAVPREVAISGGSTV